MFDVLVFIALIEAAFGVLNTLPIIPVQALAAGLLLGIIVSQMAALLTARRGRAWRQSRQSNSSSRL